MIDTNPIMNPSAPANVRKTKYPWLKIAFVAYTLCVVTAGVAQLRKSMKHS